MPTREDIIRVAGNFPQMVAYLDRDYKYVFANQPYADFIKMEMEDFVGKHVVHVTGQEDFDRRVKGVFDRALAGQQQQYDIQYPHAWARVDIIPQTTDDRGVIGFYIFASDVTAIRNAERDSAHYRAVVDSALDGIIVISEQGIVQSFNPSAVRLFGYEPHEVVGQNIKMLMPHQHRDGHDGYLARYVNGGEARIIGNPAVEADCLRKDGTTFPAELSVSEFTTNEGRAFQDVIRDITDRKRWEEDMRASHEMLEAKVEDRTRDLRIAHENLRQSQKMEAIGQLTGGIAHDFNNLLAGIIGSLDILQNRIQSGKITSIDQTTKYTIGAMEAAKKAAALTQRMLAFARRQPLEPKVISPNDAVSAMEDMVARALGAGLAFEISPEATWRIKCDPSQLENGILNLILNARDATPEGGHIYVSTRDIDETASREFDIPTGNYVRITVRDTGSGMTEAIKQRAFDPFFTTKPIGQGTGLGLSMIYGFVNQSDGHIRIDSAPNEGTAVHIFLPCVDEPLSPNERLGYGPVPETANEGQVVLVVEDEALVREIMRDTLETSGFKVIETEDAFKALDIVRSTQRIDLMVSDVGLPGMNGRQLAEEARQFRPGLGILFVTGYAQNVLSRSDILRPGMQMMTKPFDVKQLAEKVIEMVG